MITEFKIRSTDVFWSHRCTVGKNPVAFFSNPKVRTNVIYTLDVLKSILERTDKENSFIPIPRNVMQSAMDVMTDRLKLVA